MKRLAAIPVFLLFAAAPALGDVLHLKNGRTMEGTVVAKRKAHVTLKVPGGTLKIPRHTIKRIEVKLTPQDAYAKRASKTDMSDPKAVEALALWASRRGLGEQSKQLRKMAKGLELQRRVDALRDGGSAQAWLSLSVWAKQQRHSADVQRYLLGKALEVDPKHEGARLALQRLDAQERRRARRARRARAAKREQAEQAERADDERKRLTSLEKKLEKQQSETEVLRERVLELEREKQERLRELRQRRIRNQRRSRRRAWRSRYRGPYLPPRPKSPYYVRTR